MKRMVLALVVACSGCDEDKEGAADAGPQASIDGGSLPAGIAESLTAWTALAAAQPGPYWYEEENCVVNSSLGGSSIVQVEGGSARTIDRRSFPKSECRARVNRYGTVDGTIPELHQQCAALLARRADTRLGFDAQGVLAACWVGDAPSCKDNCGEGFYLRARGFGLAPRSDASVSFDAGR